MTDEMPETETETETETWAVNFNNKATKRSVISNRNRNGKQKQIIFALPILTQPQLLNQVKCVVRDNIIEIMVSNWGRSL